MSKRLQSVIESLLRSAVQGKDDDYIIRLKNVVDLLKSDRIRELEREITRLKLTARYKTIKK